MKKLFKTIFGFADKGLDIAGDLHLPVVSQIDAVKDRIKDHVKSGKVNVQQVGEIVQELDLIRHHAVSAIETARALPVGSKGMLESKRFVAAVAGILSLVAIYLGVPAEMADKLAPLVAAAIGAYLLGETVRPSAQ
jgi:hypothetical protein